MGLMVNAKHRLLYNREWRGTHCTGGCVGPRVGAGRVRKISPTAGFDLQPVQPVASCYTDWNIPAPLSSSHLHYVLLRYFTRGSLNALKETAIGNRNKTSTEKSGKGLSYLSYITSVLHLDREQPTFNDNYLLR